MRVVNTMINEYIGKALRVKNEDIKEGTLSNNKKEAMEEVEALGFVFDTEKKESVQGYATIVNPDTGRDLVISRDFDNKSTLFGNGKAIQHGKSIKEVVNTVDLYGYLTKPIESDKAVDRTSKVPEVKFLKRDIERYKRMRDSYLDDLERIREHIDYYNNLISEAQDEIVDIIQRD